MSWTPPGGGAPVGPAAGPDPVSTPAAVVPPGPPTAAPAPSAAKGYMVPVVVAVVGALLAGSLIGGIGTGISAANAPAHPSDPYPYDPGPIESVDTGSPVAVEPLECASACFDLETARLAALDDATFAMGFLPNATDVSAASPTTAADAMHEASDRWEASGLSPDWCFSTFSELPVAETQNSELGDDAVATLADHAADLGNPTRLLQTVRVFPDSAAAEGYMADLDGSLSQCDLYRARDGSTAATVVRDDALHPPDSVAALGYIRDDGVQTISIFDIQRGNLVIRSVYTTTASYDAGHFRPLMQQQADKLEELVPLS